MGQPYDAASWVYAAGSLGANAKVPWDHVHNAPGGVELTSYSGWLQESHCQHMRLALQEMGNVVIALEKNGESPFSQIDRSELQKRKPQPTPVFKHLCFFHTTTSLRLPEYLNGRVFF